MTPKDEQTSPGILMPQLMMASMIFCSFVKYHNQPGHTSGPDHIGVTLLVQSIALDM